MRLFGLLTLCLFLTNVASARSITVLSERQEKFSGTAATPNLLSVEFIDSKEKVLLDENEELADYMTSIKTVLKMDDVSHIEDYVFVQYLKGCQFESSWDGVKETRTKSIGHVYFGKVIPYVHANWDIDSDNSDPVFTAYEGYGRFGIWQWNKDPNSYDPTHAAYYIFEKPPHPVVFFNEIPAASAVLEKSNDPAVLKRAQNASLEFRTCLYKASDVPNMSTPEGEGIDFSKAIHCFEWEDKNVYDFSLNQFVTKGPIDPYCLSPRLKSM